MALFPQFPYSNLHELNLDWIIEQIRQIEGEGVVLSVNGLSGVVTLYTDKDVVFPDLNYNDHWQIFREIDNKIAGLKFTGEKFFYITKNEGDNEFTVQEVYTSGNQPPYPVTSVNEKTGNVVLAGDNILYNIDGTYTIEDVITPLEKSIGHVIRYNTCADGVSAGQYVYLILSGISGRSDGLYKAVNTKSAGTVWNASDLSPVAGGLGALMASNDSAIASLTPEDKSAVWFSVASERITITDQVCKLYPDGKVEAFIYGAFAEALRNDQTLLGYVTSILRPSADVAGVANVRTEFKGARINSNGYFIIEHGGTSVGDAFSASFTYWV